MKYKVIYIVFVLALVTIVWNELTKKQSQLEHFKRVDEFMQAGGRNTAQHGYELCKRHEFLEADYRHHHGQAYTQISCEQIYGIDGTNIKFQPFTHPTYEKSD